MRKLISALALAAALAMPGVVAATDLAAAELALENGDYADAVMLYRRAAEAGDQRAQVALGYMFWYGAEYYGPAVQGDVNMAIDWFARAAEQGNAVATSMLTLLFQEGEPTAPSRSLAATGTAQRF